MLTILLSRFARRLHLLVCASLLMLVTWALLSPDPFLAVKNTPLNSLRLISDVLLHCGAYGTLSLACCLLLGSNPRPRTRSLLVALLVTHGICSELLQANLPLRTCDPLDALANIVGIASGALLAAWVGSRNFYLHASGAKAS